MKRALQFFHPHWLVLGLLPLLLLALNRTWAFTPPGIDSWIYYGYFFNMPDFLQAYPDTYFGSRLSWILPGYLTHQIFPPLAANYALHLGLYWITISAFYATLQRLHGRKAALMGSILMGCYMPFLGAMGWNYMDGAGVGYTILTLCCLTYAATSQQRGAYWLLGAGIAYGLAIHTNLFLLVIAPPLALYHLWLNAHQARHAWLKIIGWAALGVFAITLLFCLVTYAINGHFWFFMPSIQYSLDSAAQSEGNLVTANGYNWVTEARHLIVMGIAFVGAIYCLIRAWWHKRLAENPSHVAIQLLMGCAGAIFILLQWRDAPSLLLPPYASYLLPFVFLALADQLLPAIETWSDRLFRANLLGMLCLLCLPMVWDRGRDWLGYANIDRQVWLPLALLAVAWIVVWLRPKTLPLLGIAIALVGVRTLAWQPVSNPITIFEGNDPDLQLAVAESIHTINTIDRTPHFWFAAKPNPFFESFYSLTSAYVPPYAFVSPVFPGIYPEVSLATGQHWVLLSQHGELTAEAQLTLHNRRIQSHIVKEIPIEHGEVRYVVTVLELGTCYQVPDSLDSLPISTEIFFYPASDLEAQRADLPIQYDCLVDEDEQAQHQQLFSAFDLAQSEAQLTLTSTQQTALTQWRVTKSPHDLLASGLDYILVSGQWLAQLSQAEYELLHDASRYELVMAWELRRVETQYYLYRALATP